MFRDREMVKNKFKSHARHTIFALENGSVKITGRRRDRDIRMYLKTTHALSLPLLFSRTGWSRRKLYFQNHIPLSALSRNVCASDHHSLARKEIRNAHIYFSHNDTKRAMQDAWSPGAGSKTNRPGVAIDSAQYDVNHMIDESAG